MNQKGVTFILTTHDLEDIERLAKRVVVINHGEIVFDDSLEALRGHLGDRKIAVIATRNPLPDLDIPGVTVTRRLNRMRVNRLRKEPCNFIYQRRQSKIGRPAGLPGKEASPSDCRLYDLKELLNRAAQITGGFREGCG
jgi:ABC-type multidrug transport system ATPase subunit